MRGRSLVRIQVGAAGNGGGFAISPAAVAIDPGTGAVWEWVGDDGPHAFAAADGAYESPEQDAGEWELVFDGVGNRKYSCSPHHAEGMRAVVVDPYAGVRRATGDELAVIGAAGLVATLLGVFLAAVREGATQE